jgi:hypothetical protein
MRRSEALQLYCQALLIAIFPLWIASPLAARVWTEIQREGGHRGVTEVEIVMQAEAVGGFGLFASPAGTMFAEGGPVRRTATDVKISAVPGTRG